MAFPDHYAALGIDPTADQEVITAAYRALAKKYHPDTGATTGTASAERFAEIQQAYEVLGSAESRRRYDLELLEATQRELEEHLAAKQRKIASAVGVEPPPPPPDLGIIRPERRARARGPFNAWASLKDMAPFLVVSALLLAVLGGFASLFLGNTQLPPPEKATVPPVARSLEVPAPPPGEAVAEAPAATDLPDLRFQAQPGPEDVAEDQRPLFGTSMLDQPPPAAAAAAEEPEPDPETGTASAPVPKVRPSNLSAAPEPEPDQPAAAPSNLGEAEAATPPPRRFTLVIYEQTRRGETSSEQGAVAFTSEARCGAFGEKAVLRRLAAYEGDMLRPRVWYECTETR